MEPQRLSLLLEKYSHGLATPQEVEELDEWYRNKSYQNASFPDDEEEVKGRMLSRLKQDTDPAMSKKMPYSWLVAAMLLFLSAGSYFLLKPASNYPVHSVAKLHEPIRPGSDKAILTVAGGKRIDLDNTTSGTLTTQAGTTVSKIADGKLVYNAAGNDAKDATYNTLTTPNGGQYNITLPDGTQVWLNAATRLTFPTRFVGKDREVELVGEAYFEVAKDPKKPFKVQVVGKQQVMVLGTHFNVEAYPDDKAVRTTLLEGAVKLTADQKAIVMHPGEMVINPASGALIKQQADEESVMAWKNGLFVFNDENIKSAMQKAARWYDVEIQYQDGVDQKRLGGVISKYKDITDLLDNISKSNGIHYKIDGRRVTLMK